jgi:hypothetical protein
MAQTQIRGSTQIIDATIPATKLASSLNLPTSQLQDGALFIKSDGTVTMGASLNMGGFKIINSTTPTSATDVAIKSYVDALVNGLTIHPFCRLVAVANSALTGLVITDGITPLAGDRILLTAQTTGSQNGPWLAQTTAWTRPLDWAAASVQKEGAYFLIDPDGTSYKNTKWFCTNTGTITVDTTVTTFSQDLSGTIYSNGSGISLTGTVFAVKNGNGIVFDGSNNITVNPNGTSLNVSASGVKISDGTPGQLMIAGSGNLAAFTSVTGDVTFAGSGASTVNNTSGTGFTKYGNFVTNETPGGLLNGTNTTYTLANTPVTGTVVVIVSGVVQDSGAGNDYTISGNTITMLYVLVSTDKIRANYMK